MAWCDCVNNLHFYSCCVLQSDRQIEGLGTMLRNLGSLVWHDQRAGEVVNTSKTWWAPTHLWWLSFPSVPAPCQEAPHLCR